MKRVLIGYYDQYDALEALLPRTGTLSEKRRMGSREDWQVVTLDAPFILPDSNPARLISYFVIASRWQGHRIEDPEGTSVFLLIPKKEKLPVSIEWSLDQFDHIAWGMAKLVKEPISEGSTLGGGAEPA